MGTRGLCAVRNNAGWVKAIYNHWDSYYDNLGTQAVELYFKGCTKDEFLRLAGDYEAKINSQDDDRNFLDDALFCEYAYIWNEENDTLEVYRGFFKQRQILGTSEDEKKLQMLNSIENQEEPEYFSHLIIIVDKKKHIKDEVLKAFFEYDGRSEEKLYPEHNVIKLELPENYIRLTK